MTAPVDGLARGIAAVQADPALSLRDAHVQSGMVKGAIRRAVPSVSDVLVHMEPFTPS